MSDWLARKPALPGEMIQLDLLPIGGAGLPEWNDEVQYATQNLGLEFLAPLGSKYRRVSFSAATSLEPSGKPQYAFMKREPCLLRERTKNFVRLLWCPRLAHRQSKVVIRGCPSLPIFHLASEG
jgi:hypothetical protein